MRYTLLLFLLVANFWAGYAQQTNQELKTYVYGGTVANLPIRVTLVFSIDAPIFKGSYYYTTYHPETIYILEGQCGFAVCNPGISFSKNIVSIDQIIMLREYTNGKVTANIQLCSDAKEGIKKLKGTMLNTDGKSFVVTLNLLNTH
ncbi:MAG TPA: hypothetical protein DCS93_23480 [Microscillaceae bacterium]|nr:hypothetical protein [Microscillaceae bacterium]